MSGIYLDPVAMDAAAGAIGEHAKVVEDAIDDLETTCAADVPVALAGWLAEELRDITVHARLAELLYVVAALDTALRAQQIQTDQSLATAAGYTDAPLVGGYSSFYGSGSSNEGLYPSMAVIGGPSSFTNAVDTSSFGGFGSSVAIIGGTSREQFLANNPLLAAADNLQRTNPAAAAQLLGAQSFINNSNNNMIGTWVNSRPGASYIGDGLYRGDDGTIGTISNVYRNPDRPGEYLVD